MKTLHLTLLLFSLFFALTGAAKEDAAPVSIIQPAERTLYIGEHATIVLNVLPEQVDTITISLDHNKTYNIEVTAVKKTYCKSIEIAAGYNTVEISAYHQGKKVQTFEHHLYYLSELFEGVDDDPEGYKKRYFHDDSTHKQCASCHNMKSNVPRDGNAFEDVSQTTCYSCHKSMMSKRNTHAPAANWLCLECHDGKVGEYNMDDEGASKYLVRDPVEKSCAGCHEPVKQWGMNPYVHGPVNDGRCERCHNPHGSDNEFFLRKPIWDLCTTCHSEKAEGKHVVASFVFGRNGGAHPTKGRTDPARPPRELVCSGCHNPHGSSGIYLLRMKGSMPFNVCRRCHKK